MQCLYDVISVQLSLLLLATFLTMASPSLVSSPAFYRH